MVIILDILLDPLDHEGVFCYTIGVERKGNVMVPKWAIHEARKCEPKPILKTREKEMPPSSPMKE